METQTGEPSASSPPSATMNATRTAWQDDCEHSTLGDCISWIEQQKAINQRLPRITPRSSLTPRLLLAQFDVDSITVYQAYKPSIGQQAAAAGNFSSSAFQFSRMTWVKPNFSWMMYRSAWAAKPNQEIILALKLTRTYFDHLLESAVPSSWDGVSYGSREEWRKALRASDVVVQWDPDHHLVTGAKLPYRVIQLGIRGQTLDAFRGSGFVSIADITTEAKAMRQQIATDGLSNDVRTPREKEYPMPDSLALVLGLEREAK